MFYVNSVPPLKYKEGTVVGCTVQGDMMDMGTGARGTDALQYGLYGYLDMGLKGFDV